MKKLVLTLLTVLIAIGPLWAENSYAYQKSLSQKFSDFVSDNSAFFKVGCLLTIVGYFIYKNKQSNKKFEQTRKELEEARRQEDLRQEQQDQEYADLAYARRIAREMEEKERDDRRKAQREQEERDRELEREQRKLEREQREFEQAERERKAEETRQKEEIERQEWQKRAWNSTFNALRQAQEAQAAAQRQAHTHRTRDSYSNNADAYLRQNTPPQPVRPDPADAAYTLLGVSKNADCFAIFGLTRRASKSEVKKKYVALARKFRSGFTDADPDTADERAKQVMQIINAARDQCNTKLEGESHVAKEKREYAEAAEYKIDLSKIEADRAEKKRREQFT